MQPCSHCVALAGSSQALQHIWEPRVTVREPQRAGSTPTHGGAMSAVSPPLLHVPCGLDALADLPSPSTQHQPTMRDKRLTTVCPRQRRSGGWWHLQACASPAAAPGSPCWSLPSTGPQAMRRGWCLPKWPSPDQISTPLSHLDTEWVLHQL